jgi:flagellar biosynthesis protein FlhF
MEVKTFRARSMQEALHLVRSTLGPDAAVVQAKEVGRGPMSWLTGSREIEVLALTGVHVPSRFAEPAGAVSEASVHPQPDIHNPTDFPLDDWDAMPPACQLDYRAKFREDLKNEGHQPASLVEQLASDADRAHGPDLPQPLSTWLSELIEAGCDTLYAAELVQRLQRDLSDFDLTDSPSLRDQLTRLIERDIHVCDPIQLTSSCPRVVALIGPTGVGKTTTIAKLAADFRLRRQRRVGLITVDTYRIAAVEQLRTYAEIIDLPMEVVSTPREMRLAVDRLSGLDLILIDTAGRSPRDEVQIQELKSLLTEAGADEVHLVLSSAAGATSLIRATQRFRQVGVTALLLTKLDEAAAMGGLLTLLQDSRLPVSYVTCGQNVPDDIRPADGEELARMILAMDKSDLEV